MKEQYIQILFIRNVYIYLKNNIVKIYRNLRIRILQSLLLLMLRTLLSNSPDDASFLWQFLLRQPPTIEFKQIYRFQNIWILWYSKWNIRVYYSRIPRDKKIKFETKNSNYMMKNTPRGPKNLFDLDDFLISVSSN